MKRFLEPYPRKLNVSKLISDEEKTCSIFTDTRNSKFCFTASYGYLFWSLLIPPKYFLHACQIIYTYQQFCKMKLFVNFPFVIQSRTRRSLLTLSCFRQLHKPYSLTKSSNALLFFGDTSMFLSDWNLLATEFNSCVY